MEDAYGTSGLYADLVATVVQQSSCERKHAVAALQVFGNNVERATNSIKNARRRSSQVPSHVRPSILVHHNDKFVLPEGSNTVISKDSESPQVVPSTDNRHNNPTDSAQRQPPRIPKEVGSEGLEILTSETPTNFDLQKFKLPKLTCPSPEKPFDPREGRSRRFCLERLTFSVQNGLSHADLRKYLSYFPSLLRDQSIRDGIDGIPSIFFAVETNDESIVRTWCKIGGDVNAREPKTGLPLLAFSIINATHSKDSLSVFCTLLSLGADASVLPLALYELNTGNDREHVQAPEPCESDKAWCNEFFARELQNALSVSQRYFLRRRLKIQTPSSRMMQVADQLNFAPLFGLPFTMVGQDIGIDMLGERLRTYLTTPNDRIKPLVLAFAGPSGHGKTELGRRLGDLLSLSMNVVDMTQVKYESNLFGPHFGWVGHEKGSRLNNFLAENSGRRAIVFLDEIEKAAPGILDSLLIVLDEGLYQDRRSNNHVDCSQIIWILATNSLDADIMEFDESVLRMRQSRATMDTNTKDMLLEKLLSTMKLKFGPPLSGRISTIIPFVPFSSEEQMAIAHKLLLELKSQLLKPITPQTKQLVGNVDLRIVHQTVVCQKLVKYYDRDRGARSIAAVVRNEIEPKVVGRYLEAGRKIESDQPVEIYSLDLNAEGHFIVCREDGP